MKEKLAIFDLDGTLFDTNDINYYSYKEALGYFGINLKKEFFVSECASKHYKVFLANFLNNDEDIEKAHEIKKETYSTFLDKARINSHLFNIIESIKDKYHIAIATTASKKNTVEILEHFNVLNLFELVVAQEDVKNKKPDPECFFKVMEFFKIKPEDTLIFEDSKTGLKAANACAAAVFKVERF